jgi:hypothetical protein
MGGSMLYTPTSSTTTQTTTYRLKDIRFHVYLVEAAKQVHKVANKEAAL